MLGSFITRPLRFATRVTAWGAQQAFDIAGGVVGLVVHRLAGDGDGHGDDAAPAPPIRPGSEPAAWRGPGASSTSAPGDTGTTAVAGPEPTPARRSTRPARVNGAGEVQTGRTRTREAGPGGTPPEGRPGRTRTPEARPARTRTPEGRPARTRTPEGPSGRTRTSETRPGRTRTGATPPEARREPVLPRRDPEADAERVMEAHRREQEPPPVPEPIVPEPAHVSEEPQLVEEFADAGAEEGAGATIHVAEPWEGYRAMRAADIVARLPTASTEELAAIELFEVSGRKRKSVLAAVQRALKQASPPRPS